MSLAKNFYDKDVPGGNLLTTISGIVTLLISILAGFGIFTPEQAAGVTQHVTTLLGVVPAVIGAISGLILMFKAKG